MTSSLLFIPMLSLALGAPAPPNDEPYAKVELRGQFIIEGAHRGTPDYLVRVNGEAFRLSFRERKDLLDKDELEKLDGDTVLVKGDLYFPPGDRERAVVIITSLVPVKK